MIYNDTIIAQVTCPGKSAVGILRISGSQANEVAMTILGKKLLPRFATYAAFLDQHKKVLDKGIALWFPAPFSFTGEDTLELQGHGSPVIMDLLMQNILCIPHVRIAQPGEFSERAFLNGKIDLIQAEAIDDLINAETEASARSSLNSLQGVFSEYVQELMATIISLRTQIEASIDFSEEITIDLDQTIVSKIKTLLRQFKKIKMIAVKGNLLKEGRKIVIAGLPNAGKSSLFNLLSNSDNAIVTPIPGTTRDLLYAYINIHGVPFKIIDTAGLRNSNDEVEKIGIRRAWKTIKKSDHILYVIDSTTNELEQKKICRDFIQFFSLDLPKITFILNKNDLSKYKYGIKKIDGYDFIYISAYTGEGIDILCNYLMSKENTVHHEGIFTARRRHLNQLDLSYSELVFASKNWIKFKNIELLSESLNFISKSLSQITGRFTSNDLLDRIFSDFCIGK